MEFTPLNIRSGYSFLKSGLSVERIFKALNKEGYRSAALCDYKVLFGIPSFIYEGKKNNIDTIIALECTLIFNLKHYNICLYAKNENGYINLCQISSTLSKTDNLDFNFLKEHCNGLICIISSFQESIKEIITNKSHNNLVTLSSISSLFKSFYLGLEIYNEKDKKYASIVRDFASNYSYQVIAFPKILYAEKNDAITLKIVNAIANDEKIIENEEVGFNYFHSKVELQNLYNKEELNLTAVIAKSCSVDFFTKRGRLLKYKGQKNSDLTLKEMTLKAIKEFNLEKEDYLKRLDYELDVIKNMGYSDYFLIVADYVQYAKEHKILVGPGRGSAASSLVAYLLKITSVDPLKYQLLFESFLNPARSTMPDIDIDFGDIRRDEVIEYLKEKYGHNHVANIITFQTIGAKQSIRDIGRIYAIPTHHIDLLSKAIPDNKLSLREAYKKIPAFKSLVDSDKYYLNIIRLASKIEGLPRHSSTHAAGIILNDDNLLNSIPVLIDDKNNYISQYEMNPLADQGFLKMDLLGLRNLTIIERCINKINANHQTNYVLESLPFDEDIVFSLISSTKTMGLFQLESSGIKRAIKLLEPNCFDDIVALLALFRPGPLNNIPLYAARKKGLEKTTYFCDEVKDILSSTYGIIVYQEQVLQVVTKIAGFSLSKADLFRRAISKKDASKLEIMEKEFLIGAINNGHSEELAKSIYEHILKFANYGFKKAHSVAYSMLACKMGYLKAKYPAEFYATILEQTSSTGDSKFNEYISEIKSFGINILLPSINKSTREYLVQNNSLLFPLISIKGINNVVCDDIINERKKGLFTSFFDFVIRMSSYRINSNQIEMLINSGALDEFGYTRSSLKKATLGAIEYASLISNSYNVGENNLNFILPPPLIEKNEDDPLEKLLNEAQSIGVMVSKTPLFYIKEKLASRKIKSIYDAKNSTSYVTFAGIVKTFKTIKTKKGEPMAFITFFDDDGEIEVVVFPKLYATTFMSINKNQIFIIKGKINDNSFIAEEMKKWEE